MSLCKNLYLYTNVFEKLICFLMELEIICGYYKKKSKLTRVDIANEGMEKVSNIKNKKYRIR